MENKWKASLLMPKTDFAMRAHLTTKEVKFQQMWIDQDIYRKSLKLNKNGPKGRFILHDGPPYANGNLHVGHALNKILKDIIVRYKHMEGFYAPFVMGWDTHGLPIENKMLNEMHMKKDDLNQLDLRKKATAYALKQIEIQKAQFQKMQLFTDFSQKYVTLDPQYEAAQLELFKKLALEKLVYKGLKPVYWSPSSQSALAEAEVEYQDHVSPQIIVALEVKRGLKHIHAGDKLLIMTTTPWTLLANAGVAVGQDFDYDRVKFNNQYLIIASKLTKIVIASINKQRIKDQQEEIDHYTIESTFKGSAIVGVTYQRPFGDLTAPVVSGHHVTIDAGTGLVHMAPLFGEDDYIIGQENNLDMIMHVDDKGYLNKRAGIFVNTFYQDANKDIGIKLHQNQQLMSLKFLKHSYPHDWRTHQPVIYRGVPQWFVNIEKIKPQIKQALQQVNSFPDWGVKRISDMIDTRHEWTISRQRTWGVPIIIFYDQNHKPVIKQELFDYVIAKVKKHGTDIWWEKTTDQLLPKAYRNKNWTREMDIMDVWFDSGSSSLAVEPEGEKGPFDLYLEGSDQYRGWFNSSLINSVAYRQKAPFKTLISHGFVTDQKQQKMSKSKGNVVDPLEIIKRQGADILRLWVANSEYTSDVSISDDILKQNAEIYRRFRNTFKFMLGNLFDFSVAKNQVPLQGIHEYIAHLIINYQNNVQNYYQQYKFVEVVKETNNFFIKLSSWYFSYAKDILYCDHANSQARRSIQSNIYQITLSALKMLAPILPTTMEEIYMFLEQPKKADSVFLERIKSVKAVTISQKYLLFEKHKDLVNKLIEEAIKANKIKRSNEAFLTVKIAPSQRVGNEEEYAKFFMVSQVTFAHEWNLEVQPSQKCQRCWNHFNKSQLTNQLCPRCHDVFSDYTKTI